MADTKLSALTAKGTPVAADILHILDSAASNADKRTTAGALPVSTATTAAIVARGAVGNVLLVAGSDAPAAVIARAQYVCDGTADEVQLHAAFAQAATDKAEVWLVGAFSVAAEVTVPTSWVNPVIRGVGFTYTGGVTTITAAGAMRSVLRVSNKYSKISDIKLLGNFVADYACFLDGAEGSTFERVCFGSGDIDGVHLSRTINFAEWTAAFDGSHVGSNNNGIVFLECFGTDNGMLYATTGIVGQYSGSMRTTTVTGTVSVTSGNQTVTGSGTTFTALGARKGDILRVGATAATAQYLQIESVDSDTQITTAVWRTATATVSGSTSWAVGAGDGYHEERHLDNNLSIIRGGLWRNNGGVGFRFCGLYGPRLEVAQSEYNGSYGVSVGTADNDGQVRFSHLDHPYFEGNVCPAPVLLAMAYGITIDQPVWDTAVGTFHIGLASQNLGIAIDQRGVTPIGDVASTVPLIIGTVTGLQAALDARQALDADLTTIAGLTATTDNLIQSVGSAWASRTPAQVKTALALVIGTNVQAWDADLDTYAGKTPPSGAVVGTTDTQTLSGKTLTAPTLADFTNAGHDHLDADDGGVLTPPAVGLQPLAQTVAYAASITPDAALGALVKVGSLTGALTINAPTNPVEGRTLAFYLPQDGTGGRVVTFNSVFKNPPVIDATAPASAHDLAAFVYVNSVWVRSRV